jgi:hypothetical protein
MAKPQIAVRIPKYLLVKLSNHVERNRTLITEVVVSALAGYLQYHEEISLNQRIAELEKKLHSHVISKNQTANY